MGAKGIAGHQNLLLLDKCVHGIRPVQVWNQHEMQRPLANGHPLAVLHRNADKVPVHNFF